MEKEIPIRKPILTTSMRRNSENHPEFLDTETLLERFDPLLRSIHKRFCSYDGIFNTMDDMNDLWNQIVYEFLRLRQNYDPKRGVDFPGYIKFHLQQRVYHYVTKTQKVVNHELSVNNYNSEDDEKRTLELENSSELIDERTIDDMEHVEAIASIPWNRIDDLYKSQFIQEILINHVPLETYAKEQHISLKAAKQKLEDCCQLLANIYNNESDFE